tara:strand:+ start:5879 stop:6088 length:210 start_codon:yes stop_codon:yes gene_type:complete
MIDIANAATIEYMRIRIETLEREYKISQDRLKSLLVDCKYLEELNDRLIEHTKQSDIKLSIELANKRGN